MPIFIFLLLIVLGHDARKPVFRVLRTKTQTSHDADQPSAILFAFWKVLHLTLLLVIQLYKLVSVAEETSLSLTSSKP